MHSVGICRNTSTRLGQQKEVLNPPRDKKNERRARIVGRGEEELLCDPGSELCLFIYVGRREKKKGENY